jgi:hypothetical protein
MDFENAEAKIFEIDWTTDLLFKSAAFVKGLKINIFMNNSFITKVIFVDII